MLFHAEKGVVQCEVALPGRESYASFCEFLDLLIYPCAEHGEDLCLQGVDRYEVALLSNLEHEDPALIPNSHRLPNSILSKFLKASQVLFPQ